MGSRRRRRARPVEVAGVISRVLSYQEDTGWMSARVRQGDVDVNLVGTAPMKPTAGMHVHAKGEPRTHAVYGDQIHAESIELSVPDTHDGREAYLRTIAPFLLSEEVALAASFTGDLAIDLVPGIAETAALELRDRWAIRHHLYDLFTFLTTNGVSAETARRVGPRLAIGNSDPIATLRENPFALVALGAPFEQAEALRHALRAPTESDHRYLAGIAAAAAAHCEDTGDTLLTRAELVAATARTLRESTHRVEPHVARALASGLITATGAALQPSWLAAAEERIAREIQRLIKAWRPLPCPSDAAIAAACGFEPSSAQIHAVRSAFTSPITIITGPAGVGKSSIVRAIVSLTRAQLLAATTGMAAKRLSGLTGKPATTIHRALDGKLEGERWVFPAGRFGGVDVVVFDEFSEADAELAAGAFAAAPSGVPLVIIGDVHQLDSVGPGYVLGDLIAAGVHTVVLDANFRQKASSPIPAVGRAILAGELPALPTAGAVRFIPARMSAHAIEVAAVVRGLQAAGLGQRSIRVLSPMWGGSFGINRLNAMLQALWNPKASTDAGVHVRQFEDERGMFEERFFVGDPILLTMNDHERQIYNGEIFHVIAMRARGKSAWVKIRADDGRLFELVGGRQLAPFRLAYANTIHRAQGGEAPHVVIALVRGHQRMLTRRLLYTAVTRAKTSLTIVGELAAIRMAIHDAGEVRARRTGLRERVAEALGGGVPRAAGDTPA
jgi:exodeoxyribonuclease V alpha subunit